MIVCIENEPEMIGLIKLILRHRDYQPVGAVGGRDGLEAVQKLNPDLVLPDLMMPDVDGWEVYRQMQADDELKDTSVFVITAQAQRIDRVLGDHIAKVDDCITKPFSPRELVESVAGILDADS